MRTAARFALMLRDASQHAAAAAAAAPALASRCDAPRHEGKRRSDARLDEDERLTALHRGGDPLLELLLRRRADLTRGHLAGLENHQRRDRLNAVLRRGLRIFIHVELDDLHLAVERARDLLERWRDHATGPAPLGPKIDHDRFGRLQHLGFECGVRNFANGHGRYLVARRKRREWDAKAP